MLLRTYTLKNDHTKLLELSIVSHACPCVEKAFTIYYLNNVHL